MEVQLLNKRLGFSSKLTLIIVRYYAIFAFSFPEKNTELVKRTVSKIVTCRTEYRGCEVYKCPIHPVFRIVPHSCGHRFCPLCSGSNMTLWVEDKVDFLTSINTSYCMLTFTLPGMLSSITQENKEKLLGELFHAVANSLRYWCKKRGFTPGIIMILQTAGDELNFHPHIHLIITCGGLSLIGDRWISLEPKKLKRKRNGKRYHPTFPPGPILQGFKSSFYRALRRAYKADNFNFPRELVESIATEKKFNRMLDYWWKIDWNFDISDPLRNTEEIIRYISRYLKKAPISSRRILSHDENSVTFSAKDRNSKSRRRRKAVTLPTDYFLMRLFEHIPLDRFHLVRYYGIFSNRNKGKLMPIVQRLIPPAGSTPPVELAEKPLELEEPRPTWREKHKEKYGEDPLVCPICGRELELCATFRFRELKRLNISFEQIPQFLLN